MVDVAGRTSASWSWGRGQGEIRSHARRSILKFDSRSFLECEGNLTHYFSRHLVGGLVLSRESHTPARDIFIPLLFLKLAEGHAWAKYLDDVYLRARLPRWSD